MTDCDNQNRKMRRKLAVVVVVVVLCIHALAASLLGGSRRNFWSGRCCCICVQTDDGILQVRPVDVSQPDDVTRAIFSASLIAEQLDGKF